MKRFEISLWDNCKNGCSFCWTHNSPKANKVRLEQRLEAIEKAKSIIEEATPNDDILITGGEIFDTSQDDEELNIAIVSLLEKLILSILFNKIHHLFIITNLINSNERLIDYLLQLIKPLSQNNIQKIHITTSYDVVGRFKSDEAKSEFFTHLKKFSSILPKQNIVVNTILTKTACKQISSDVLDIYKNQYEYNCTWEMIPFVSNIEEETPTKKEVFDAIKHVENKIPGYVRNYLSDMDCKTESVYLKLRGSEVVNSTVGKLPCGHSINFAKYASDSDSCFMCDLDEEFNITNKNNGYISIELWPDCSINCPFCFNQDRKKHTTSSSKKIEAIEKVSSFLEANFYKYKTIQIMGGEFFNGELEDSLVFDKFMSLCSTLNTIGVKHNKQICIYSALKGTHGLFEAMDILTKDAPQDIIKFNSSFNYGITHNANNADDFVGKILEIRKRYPQTKIHIQSLLSDNIINMDFNDVMAIYEPFLVNDVEIDFHPVTIIGINTWTERNGDKFKEILKSNPITKNIAIKSRDKALEFCTNLYYNFGKDCFHNFRNNTTRAETKWLVASDIWENEISTSELHCDMEKCGHTYHMANAYLDSDECLSCDINKLLEVLE